MFAQDSLDFYRASENLKKILSLFLSEDEGPQDCQILYDNLSPFELNPAENCLISPPPDIEETVIFTVDSSVPEERREEALQKVQQAYHKVWYSLREGVIDVKVSRTACGSNAGTYSQDFNEKMYSWFKEKWYCGTEFPNSRPDPFYDTADIYTALCEIKEGLNEYCSLAAIQFESLFSFSVVDELNHILDGHLRNAELHEILGSKYLGGDLQNEAGAEFQTAIVECETNLNLIDNNDDPLFTCDYSSIYCISVESAAKSYALMGNIYKNDLEDCSNAVRICFEGIDYAILYSKENQQQLNIFEEFALDEMYEMYSSIIECSAGNCGQIQSYFDLYGGEKEFFYYLADYARDQISSGENVSSENCKIIECSLTMLQQYLGEQVQINEIQSWLTDFQFQGMCL